VWNKNENTYLCNFTFFIFLSSLGPYQLVRPASPSSAMPEHHTRQVTTDKLEEADKTLSQDNSTLNNKIDTIHASLIAKIEALFDRFAAIAVNSPPPPPPMPSHSSSSSHRHHMKLEVPRFDGHDPLGWIFKISQFFWLLGNSWEWEAHSRLLLHGRPRAILVSMDVPQRLLPVLTGDAAGPGIAFCPFLLRRPPGRTVQTSANRHGQRIPNGIRALGKSYLGITPFVPA